MGHLTPPNTGGDQSGRKLFLVATQDLASRYCFEPLVTLDPGGHEVTTHLDHLFARQWPSLCSSSGTMAASSIITLSMNCWLFIA